MYLYHMARDDGIVWGERDDVAVLTGERWSLEDG